MPRSHDAVRSVLAGISGILVTPFGADDRPVPAWLAPIVDHAIAAGVQVLVANGNTSEFYALTTAEAERMVHGAAEHVAGRVPLLAGVGRALPDALALARASAKAGAGGGLRLCQARNADGSVAREYLAEGEYLPGSPATDRYTMQDPVGTVRRVFVSSTEAPAYAYDPYGQALQTTAPTTDFNYAGMFLETGSGLDLTLAREYDPQAGRWLSRDPTPVATSMPMSQGIWLA